MGFTFYGDVVYWTTEVSINPLSPVLAADFAGFLFGECTPFQIKAIEYYKHQIEKVNPRVGIEIHHYHGSDPETKNLRKRVVETEILRILNHNRLLRAKYFLDDFLNRKMCVSDFSQISIPFWSRYDAA